MDFGNLINQEGIKSQLIEITTDKFGFALFEYLSPAKIFDNYNIRITVFSSDGSVSAKSGVYLKKKETIYTTGSEKNITYIDTSFNTNNGITTIRVPSVFSPGNISICNLSDYIESVYNNTVPVWVYPSSVTIDKSLSKIVEQKYAIHSSTDRENVILNKDYLTVSFPGTFTDIVVRLENITNRVNLDRRCLHV